MDKYQKKNNYDTDNKSCQVLSRPSLFETLEAVKVQVDYQDFAEPLPSGKMYIDPIYEEICLIIAEVFARPSGRVMRIRGQEIEVGIVQEVYSKLDHERVELVVDNFRKQTHPICYKSAYLQTALYNCVFEFEAHNTNLVKQGMC